MSAPSYPHKKLSGKVRLCFRFSGHLTTGGLILNGIVSGTSRQHLQLLVALLRGGTTWRAAQVLTGRVAFEVMTTGGSSTDFSSKPCLQRLYSLPLTKVEISCMIYVWRCSHPVSDSAIWTARGHPMSLTVVDPMPACSDYTFFLQVLRPTSCVAFHIDLF